MTTSVAKFLIPAAMIIGFGAYVWVAGTTKTCAACTAIVELVGGEASVGR